MPLLAFSSAQTCFDRMQGRGPSPYQLLPENENSFRRRLAEGWREGYRARLQECCGNDDAGISQETLSRYGPLSLASNAGISWRKVALGQH